MKPHEQRLKNLKTLIEQRYSGIVGRFADAMGKKRPTIYRLFSESESARDIGEDLAREIERVHQLPTHWLDVDHSRDIANEAKVTYHSTEEVRMLSRLPLISWVRAGQRDDANDPYAPGNAEDWLEFESASSRSAFCLRVRGDSMVRPDGTGFPEGTVIAVEPTRKARSGDFVVVRFQDSDQATFKQYFIEGAMKYLKPLNPAHPTIIVTPDAFMVGVVFEKRIVEKY